MDPTSLEPDGRFIAVSCSRTRIWDTARDQMVAELPRVSPALDDFEGAFPAVSAAGDRAAIARGSSVEIYAVPGGELLRTIVHAAAVNAVAFAPTGHDVVTGAIDGSLLLSRDGRDPTALPSSQAGIDVAAILVDGRVVAADSRRRLRIYDPDHRLLLADLETTARLRMLRPSPDGHLLVGLAIFPRAVPPALWDLMRYTRIAQLEGHLGLVYSARFVPNGILTAGGDGTVRLWHAVTGELRETYRAKSRFLVDAVLSPDGAAVVAGGADGVLRFWDATNGRPLWTMRAHASVIVGIHVEGKDIVTRSLAGDLTRWSLPDAGAVIKACVGRRECGAILQ